MKIMPVNGSNLLEAALENVDQVEWIFWGQGICALYEEVGSVLCFYPAENKGYLLKGLTEVDIFPRKEDLILVTLSSVFSWNGRENIHETTIPRLINMDIGEQSFCGWKDFRYYFVSGAEEYLLPMGAKDVRLFPDGESVFWEHWGTIFCWAPSGIVTYEAISENYEKILPLSKGWLVFVYERKIIALHPKYPQKSWTDDQLLDVISSVEQSSLYILLADGYLLEWIVDSVDEPEEIAEINGEMFVGAQAVLVDDEIVLID